MQLQARLFAAPEPSLDRSLSKVVRHDLGHGAWLDHLPGWIRGDDALFDHLVRCMRWREEERPMYERIVAIPRLLAGVPTDGPGHPVLQEASSALEARYRRAIVNVHMALYRGGDDSVAFHSDRVGEDRLDDSVVAIVSLRGPRRLRLRAKKGGGSRAFDLGFGDLLVMGGSIQRHFDHGVPKVASAPPRMSVMLRDA